MSLIYYVYCWSGIPVWSVLIVLCLNILEIHILYYILFYTTVLDPNNNF